MIAAGGCRLLVAFDELATEPAKDVIGDAAGVADIGILGEAARLEALVSEFLYQALERDAILQRHRGEGRDRVHEAADRTSFFRHLDEELSRLAVFVEADGDVAFVPRDLEFVRQ